MSKRSWTSSVRGDVYRLRAARDAVGHEQQGPRYAVVLQSDDLNLSTAKDIMSRFAYCFVAPPGSDYPPILDNHAIEAGESRVIEGKGGPLEFSAFLLQHGNIPALGYRIGTSTISRPRAGLTYKISISGLSTGCAIPGIPAISASTTRCHGSTASSRAAPSSPTCIPIWITRCCG